MKLPPMIDKRRWKQFSSFEQMANIGAEVGRSLKARQDKRPEDFEPAVYRALDLFDATIEDMKAQETPRLKEVLLAKEQYIDIAYKLDATSSEMEGIENYFMQFAIAARLNR